MVSLLSELSSQTCNSILFLNTKCGKFDSLQQKFPATFCVTAHFIDRAVFVNEFHEKGE